MSLFEWELHDGGKLVASKMSLGGGKKCAETTAPVKLEWRGWFAVFPGKNG